MRSAGIHHITAIAGAPQRNLDFYTEALGLRLVTRTVNFDDPGSYHFYFGDNIGTPGTIMTFLPWPGARRGARGRGQLTVVSLAVPRKTITGGVSAAAAQTRPRKSIWSHPKPASARSPLARCITLPFALPMMMSS